MSGPGSPLGHEPPPGYEFREHVGSDYAALRRLWQADEAGGLGLSAADEEEAIVGFLAQNPGLSMGVWREEKLVASILVGSDGRRGYIYHLIVRPEDRGLGLGRLLVRAAMDALRGRGVGKAHAYVYADNAAGRAFWERLGFVERVELVVWSQETREPGTPITGVAETAEGAGG